jgi:hypothetical protein
MLFQTDIDTTTRIAIVNGTLLSIMQTITYDDILKTIILSILGAIVSFGVSMCLKWIMKKLKL